MNQNDIETAICTFVVGGDQQDTSALEPVLHEHFRVALRNADGVVTLIARDAYLTQIREKKMGGHPRSIAIEQVDILDDAIANAKVTLRSDVMRFDTYFALVKRSSGPWQIIDYLLITKPLQS